MGVYTTPTQLRVAQRRRFERVRSDMRKVHREMAEGGFKDFLQGTSGRVTTRQLRAMGHPFARMRLALPKGAGRFRASARKGQITRSGAVRTLPINRQDGSLRRAIKLRGPSGSLSTFRLFSDAPHAKYVLSPTGTRFMVPRGLLGPLGLLRKRHKARAAALIDVVRRSQRRP